MEIRTLLIKTILIWLALAGASLWACEPIRSGTEGSVIISQLVGVYDGDSFTVSVAGWPDIIGESIPIRIEGVDTPEIRGKCKVEKEIALRARTFSRDQLTNAKVIELRNMQRGKYFRILADVCLDGVSLGRELIRTGLAVEYQGRGQKRDWCE